MDEKKLNNADRFVRKRHFNGVVELCDRVRPGYPQELPSDVLHFAGLSGAGPWTVLDVGCGTGKSTELFLIPQTVVHGIDIGEAMVDFCRRRFADAPNARFTQVSFEDLEVRSGEPYDLVVSGTAFHWVDTALGYKKAVSLLKPGGCIAVF